MANGYLGAKIRPFPCSDDVMGFLCWLLPTPCTNSHAPNLWKTGIIQDKGKSLVLVFVEAILMLC